MLQADIDKLLLRRLYLQRYATSIFNEVAKANRPLDRRLIFTLAEFIADADDKTLLALSRQSAGNPASRKLLSDISQILREQKDAARLILKESTDALIEREAIATTVAMGETKYRQCEESRRCLSLAFLKFLTSTMRTLDTHGG